MKKTIFFLIGLFLLTSIQNTFAESSKHYAMNRSREVRQMQRAEKERVKKMQRLEERRLRKLKRVDAKQYREIMQAKRRSQKIDEITSRLREGKISKTVAKKKLAYYLNGSLKRRILELDRELERTQERVDYLRRIKKNPAFLVEEEVNRYLGEGATGYPMRGGS